MKRNLLVLNWKIIAKPQDGFWHHPIGEMLFFWIRIITEVPLPIWLVILSP